MSCFFIGSYSVVHPSSSSNSSSIVFVVVFIEVCFCCLCMRLVVLWSPCSSFPPIVGLTSAAMDWTMGFCDDVDDVFTHASASARTKSSASSSKSKERENRKRSVFLGSSEQRDFFALQRAEGRHTKARCSSKRGKRRGGKRVSIYYLVRRARIRAHLRVALVPGVVHADGSTARNRVVLLLFFFFFVLLSADEAFFFSRGRRHKSVRVSLWRSRVGRVK